MIFDLYNQNQNTLVVAGLDISGFGEGDWVNVNIRGGGAVSTQGADTVILNRTVAAGALLTFLLMPTSPALPVFMAMRDEQVLKAKSKKTVSQFGIQLYSGTMEQFSASGCAFADLPQFGFGGPTMTPRQFAFECVDFTYAKVLRPEPEIDPVQELDI